MSRVSSLNNTIDWSWFNDAEPVDVQNVVLAVSNMEVIIFGLTQNNEEAQETFNDVKELISNMTGVFNGSLVSQEEWYDTWLSQNSQTQFAFSYNFIKERVQIRETSDLSNFLQISDTIMKFVIYRYFGNPIPAAYLAKNAVPGIKPRLSETTSPYYTKLQTYLHSFFLNGVSGVSGIGNNTISDMCKNFTRETIHKYTPILDWCGCFSPDSELTIESKKQYPESVSYTKACDLLCINPNAIKLVIDQPPYINQECDSTLCIMSNFALQDTDSNTTINLNQICPCSQPGKGPCLCVIDSSIETDILNKVTAPNGGSMAAPVTFNQYCPGANCYIEDDKTKELKQVKCDTGNPSATAKINSETVGTYTVISKIWILLVSIFAAGILLILCARHIGYEPKFKIKGVLKPKARLSKYTKSTDIPFLRKA